MTNVLYYFITITTCIYGEQLGLHLISWGWACESHDVTSITFKVLRATGGEFWLLQEKKKEKLNRVKRLLSPQITHSTMDYQAFLDGRQFNQSEDRPKSHRSTRKHFYKHV